MVLPRTPPDGGRPPAGGAGGAGRPRAQWNDNGGGVGGAGVSSRPSGSGGNGRIPPRRKTSDRERPPWCGPLENEVISGHDDDLVEPPRCANKDIDVTLSSNFFSVFHRI